MNLVATFCCLHNFALRTSQSCSLTVLPSPLGARKQQPRVLLGPGAQGEGVAVDAADVVGADRVRVSRDALKVAVAASRGKNNGEMERQFGGA